MAGLTGFFRAVETIISTVCPILTFALADFDALVAEFFESEFAG